MQICNNDTIRIMVLNRFVKDIDVNQPLQVVKTIIDKGTNETFVEPITSNYCTKKCIQSTKNSYEQRRCLC